MSRTDNILIRFIEERGLSLGGIETCIEHTVDIRKQLKNLYSLPPFSSDVDLIVYGSIARNECTAGSDIDWSLLVDGQANVDHMSMSLELRERIAKAGFKQPGASGMFGHVTISHELIHQIGGLHDTNHNLTKRILLLLESEKINFEDGPSSGGTAHDRVVAAVIKQYVNHDSGLNSNRKAIPRFLLNDVVRFWRTMCVDFAYKQKEQGGDKWALRNIKLRMSRKMLFVKGLLMCLSLYEDKPNKTLVCEKIKEMAGKTPFELILSLQPHFGIADQSIVRLLTYYNSYLEKLNDETTRNDLEQMNMREVYNNPDFIALRNICDEFQRELDHLFINDNSPLQQLTLKYGIF